MHSSDKKLAEMLESIPAIVGARASGDPLAGAGILTVQASGEVTVLVLEAVPTLRQTSPAIAMALALLQFELASEKNQRIAALLSKAIKDCDFALQIKTGEIITNQVH